jgi:predicted NAD/FAD-binding protein
MKRVAVIGSGISGLSAAYGLRQHAQVTVFEAEGRPGGHANTVDLKLDGISHGVDTGFLVYNERTYPQLIALFAELGVDTAASDMSFSVQVPDQDLEWNGSDLNTVFAQRRNLLRPAFLRMLREILRFNKLATGIARRNAEAELDEPIGDFLRRERFSLEFRDWYFLPMIGCIWSCPTDQMLRFPVATMIRFCHNHGLIQVNDRPQWRTVRGGSRQYVQKLLAALGPQATVRLGTPVRAIGRTGDGVQLSVDSGTEHFDEVVMAAHSNQSLALLQDPSDDERAVLGAIRYHDNRAVLHTDASVLPKRHLAWAAWNYERAAGDARDQAQVCLHYLINKLQPLPWNSPVIVSLNPVRPIDPARVSQEIAYAHPVFDRAAVAAQQHLLSLQGQRHTWYCGAWTRYGFHEDGMMSGSAVAQSLGQRLAEDAAEMRP